MRRILCRTAMVALAAALFAGGAVAQQGDEDITVTATRVEKARIAAGPGVKVYEYRVSYPVDYRDLDVNTASGKATLRQRVSKTAMRACMDIEAEVPHAKPDNEACARMATEEAMAKVRQSLAAN